VSSYKREVEPEACKRPYDLSKRQESSDRNRAAVVEAAKAILKRDGFLQFTMAAIAKESRLSRQTVHNLFGTKTDLIEALFDDIAFRAGMQNMRVIMQSSDAAWMTSEYLRLMVSLWSNDRLLIRRIHGLRAIDPELGAALRGRDQRKKMAIGRIMEVLERSRASAFSTEERQYHESILCAFTSFEVYEQLVENLASVEAVSEVVLHTVGRALHLEISGGQ
jgi:AcrR family transcriptional regulator